MEFCGLCNRLIHDWSTHIKSSEHQRNARKKIIDMESITVPMTKARLPK
jgi:hypothetical protein